jgi:cytoplasmic iron level regulating protein YaaA (DUF328/UPF0246 family)
MYTNVWNKYLPIIRIVLKKSLSAEQILNLNSGDFERSGSSKSAKKFAMKFKDGKVDNVIVDSPMASILAGVLLKDPVVKELFNQNDFIISLNTKYQLNIRHIPRIEVAAEATPAEATG